MEAWDGPNPKSRGYLNPKSFLLSVRRFALTRVHFSKICFSFFFFLRVVSEIDSLTRQPVSSPLSSSAKTVSEAEDK